jgi:probable HAF family extracellular repeat protein
MVAPCCNTINDKGQVVGFWFDAMFNAHAFIWQDNTLTNLDDLIPSDSPWQLQFAQAINDAGAIVGQGLIGGESHAFLATPCDRYHADSEGCQN